MTNATVVWWAKNNNVNIKNEEISLSGFAQFGSIVALTKVKYDSMLKLEANVRMLESVQIRSALLDLDFNGSNTSFASVIYDKGMIFFVIKDGNCDERVSSTNILHDHKWHNIQVIIEDQNVKFFVDNILVGAYTYSDKLYCVQPSFGNNYDLTRQDLKNEISFIVKDINCITRYGDFPLNVNELASINRV